MQSLARNGYTAEQVTAALQGRYGARQVEYRYNRLDETNTLVDELGTVLDGSVAHDGLADVKRTARFRVRDDGTLDFLNDRIQPVVRLHMPDLPVAGDVRPSTTYEDAVSSVRGLLARWRFDELAGATTASDTVAGNDLTLGAGATAGAAPLLEDTGRSLAFDGTAAGTAYTPSAGFLSSLTSVSFAGWLKPNTAGVNVTLISTTSGQTWADKLPKTWDQVAAGTWGTTVPTGSWDDAATRNWQDLGNWDSLTVKTGGLFVRFLADTRNYEVSFYIGSQLVVATTPANTQTTERTFLAFTWVSGGSLRIYLDGRLVTEVASTNVVGGLTGIGSILVGGEGFDGRLDDMLWSSSRLTDSTIRDLYVTGAGIGPAAPPDRRYVDFPQGVFVLSTPARSADVNGVVTRNVDAYDQTVILQQTLTADAYYVASGAIVTDAIAEILDFTAGVPLWQVVGSAKTLPTLRVWDAGTSHLRIVNDLIAAIGYEAVWFDEAGSAVVAPYLGPSERPAGYRYTADAVSVLVPGAEQSLDLWQQPNRWVLAVSQPDRPLLVAAYTNTDPASPTSTVNRGRVITDFRTETDVVDQAVLDAKVQDLADEAAQKYEQVEFRTAVMPFHQHRDVVWVEYPALGVAADYSETRWAFDLVPGAEMTHTARRVVVLNGELA